MKTKMNTWLLCGSLVAGFMLASYAAGPLTPPGAPGDGSNGGPSLTEIKAAIDALDTRTRIPATVGAPAAGPFYTITQPGSYVLTGNITVSTGNGIDIIASNVTIDLAGYRITSTATPATGAGFQVYHNTHSVRIRNGTISSSAVSGSDGFSQGILHDAVITNGGLGEGYVFEDLTITGMRDWAIRCICATTVNRNYTARRVSISGRYGIQFYTNDVFGFGPVPTGKVIDCECNVSSIVGIPAIQAAIVGNCVTYGGIITATTAFNNN